MREGKRYALAPCGEEGTEAFGVQVGRNDHVAPVLRVPGHRLISHTFWKVLSRQESFIDEHIQYCNCQRRANKEKYIN